MVTLIRGSTIDRVIENSEGGYSEYSGSYNSYNYASENSYSRNNSGYSRAEEEMDSMIAELREMMGELPPEKQAEVQRFIQKLEQMN